MTSTYVSSIAFMQQREILNKVLDLYDEMDTIVDIMELTGRYVQTSQEDFRYHVNTRLHKAAVINGSEAEPAAGASSTITLTAGSVKPRVNDIMLTAGRYRSFVSAVAGNDITVKPLSNSAIAHEAFVGGEAVTFFSNAYAEGTGVNPGYIYDTLQYVNNIQIIKGDFSVTDVQAKTKVEVEFEGKPYYFIKGQADAFNRFKMDVAHAILLGEKGETTDAAGKTVRTTQGLEKAVRGSGVQLPLDTTDLTAGGPFEDDFEAFSRALDQARGPKEYWMWNGPSINNKFDNWLTQKEGLKAGGIVYNSFNGIDGKSRAVSLGFDSFHIYGRTYHKKPLAMFDNPELTAASGFTYPDTMLLIPATKVKCNHDGEMKDRFRIRYIETAPGTAVAMADSQNKYYEVLTGGLAPTPTSKEMRLDVTYNTWQGPEFLGLEHFGINTFSGSNS